MVCAALSLARGPLFGLTSSRPSHSGSRTQERSGQRDCIRRPAFVLRDEWPEVLVRIGMAQYLVTCYLFSGICPEGDGHCFATPKQPLSAGRTLRNLGY